MLGGRYAWRRLCGGNEAAVRTAATGIWDGCACCSLVESNRCGSTVGVTRFLPGTKDGMTAKMGLVKCYAWDGRSGAKASEGALLLRGLNGNAGCLSRSRVLCSRFLDVAPRRNTRGPAGSASGGGVLWRRTTALRSPAGNSNDHDGHPHRGGSKSDVGGPGEGSDKERSATKLIDLTEEYDLQQELAATFVESGEGEMEERRRGGGAIGDGGLDSGRVGPGGWGVGVPTSGAGEGSAGTGSEGAGMAMPGLKRIQLVRLDRPPGRFDLLTNSLAYAWHTTAGLARKVSGPLREWAAELKYRTGVHLELEPSNPSRLSLSAEDGGYRHADEVEITVFLFGSERGIFNCAQLMESIIDQEPSYVRLAVFRRVPHTGDAAAGRRGTRDARTTGGEEGVVKDASGEGGVLLDADNRTTTAGPTETASSGVPMADGEEVEWLLLRRINRELRPPDIPPISLKLPGKYTLLYEQYKEAAIRTLWEETGITVEPSAVFPTGRLFQDHPEYYWRVPVQYFIAEVPYDVEVKGPQTDVHMYMRDWDKKLLQQSPDPIDRTWAAFADPETGCAWLRRSLIDELQREWRGEDYMRIRYTPPPYSGLAEVVGLMAEEG